MVSLQTVILCSSIALFALTLEANAGVHHYKLPGKNVTHTHRYKKPGMNVTHTHRYKKPGMNVTHTYQYKKPGMTDEHTYRYKKPGHTNVHTYRYKTPGHTNEHTYRYKTPGMTNIHHYGNPSGAGNNVTGVYYIMNMIYNYFAVGGRLTGIPPMDLTLLRYYVAQGPKNFCPK